MKRTGRVQLLFLHLSEQYLTSFQTFSHFLRQANGLPQRTQILVGKFSFFMPLGIRPYKSSTTQCLNRFSLTIVGVAFPHEGHQRIGKKRA